MSKHTVRVYCVISPPLIDKNQNFFTLIIKKKLKKYIKIVYIEIFEGSMENKGNNNQPGGILLSF